MGLIKSAIRSLLNFSHRDKGIMFSETGDSKMESAIQTAKESLPEFLSLLSKHDANIDNFAVKVGLKTKDDSVEHC